MLVFVTIKGTTALPLKVFVTEGSFALAGLRDRGEFCLAGLRDLRFALKVFVT